MSRRHTFTSESVTEGHPDKIADQISDAILDALLEQARGRVACETLLTTGLVVVAGEVTTTAYVDVPGSSERRSATIGCDRRRRASRAYLRVIVSLDEQSPDIAPGVRSRSSR